MNTPAYLSGLLGHILQDTFMYGTGLEPQFPVIVNPPSPLPPPKGGALIQTGKFSTIWKTQKNHGNWAQNGKHRKLRKTAILRLKTKNI